MQRKNYTARTIAAFLSSLVFSPGMLVGHGVLPFPAGLAVLAYIYDSSLGTFNLVSNLLCCVVTFAVFLVIAYRFPLRAKAIDAMPNSTVEPSALVVESDAQGEPKRSEARRYVAAFTSTENEHTSYHRAIVDEGIEGLALSVYKGDSTDSLTLDHTYTAATWEELGTYLKSKTIFRRGDFRVDA